MKLPLALELPDTGWLIVLAVIFGVFSLVGIAVVLRFGQQLRKSLAEELRTELDKVKKPAAVEVQQPFEVKQAASHVTKEDHDKQIEKIDSELKRHAARRAEIYELQSAQAVALASLKTESAATKETVAKVEGKIDANTQLTARIDGKVEQINQSVHTLTTTLTQFIREHRSHQS